MVWRFDGNRYTPGHAEAPEGVGPGLRYSLPSSSSLSPSLHLLIAMFGYELERRRLF